VSVLARIGDSQIQDRKFTVSHGQACFISQSETWMGTDCGSFVHQWRDLYLHDRSIPFDIDYAQTIHFNSLSFGRTETAIKSKSNFRILLFRHTARILAYDSDTTRHCSHCSLDSHKSMNNYAKYTILTKCLTKLLWSSVYYCGQAFILKQCLPNTLHSVPCTKLKFTYVMQSRS